MLAIFFVMLLTLPAPATADDEQITINVLQPKRSEGPAAKATLYLKRLIEQRTDHRIELVVQLNSTEKGSVTHQQPLETQMAIVDTNLQPEAIAQQFNSSVQTIGNYTDSGYRLYINADIWNRLSDELKIILQGAIDDTLSYLSELNRKS